MNGNRRIGFHSCAPAYPARNRDKATADAKEEIKAWRESWDYLSAQLDTLHSVNLYLEHQVETRGERIGQLADTWIRLRSHWAVRVLKFFYIIPRSY